MENEYDQLAFQEFPSLLPIGRHDLPVQRIHELCVDGFPDSTTRNVLMEILEGVVTRLREARVRGELWIGGSFLTEKPDPADIDVVLRMRATWLEGASLEQRAAVNWFLAGLSDSEQVDNYPLIEWPRSHKNYWFGEYAYAYWLRQWGFGRDDSLKGIAVIRLRGR